jgi:hypothetical protein
MFSTIVLHTSPMRVKEKEDWGYYVSLCDTPPPSGRKKKSSLNVSSFSLMTRVAGPGGAPGLEDYEPSVLLYTTPRYKKNFPIIR